MMERWAARLNGNPLEWLLQSDDPALRYRVMVDLEGIDPEGSEAKLLRERATATGPVAQMLSRQAEGGYWGREEDFYMRSKYRGTVWNLVLLAELGADPEHHGVKKACHFVLSRSQRPEGGFTYRTTHDGKKGLALRCLSGNMVWALSRLGFSHDPQVCRGREALVEMSQGGREWSSGGRCIQCRSGDVKLLKALAEVNAPTPIEKDVIDLLCARVLRDALPGGPRPVRPEWSGSRFPLMWDTDLVEIVTLLARCGKADERVVGTVDQIMSMQNDLGCWAQMGTYQGRCLVPVEGKGRPSRWSTLRVLTMLKSLEK